MRFAMADVYSCCCSSAKLSTVNPGRFAAKSTVGAATSTWPAGAAGAVLRGKRGRVGQVGRALSPTEMGI